MNDKDFLELIWKHGMLADTDLRLTSGEPIHVLSSGFQSDKTTASPEFSHAAIRIGNSDVTLHGSIKIDVRSSDWRRTNTVLHPSFDNVVLHIVNQCDIQVMQRERLIPTASVEIPQYLIDRKNDLPIECHEQFNDMEEVFRENFISRLTTDRLVRKSHEVIDILHSVNGDWPKTALITMMRSMGYMETKKAYESLARSIPYHVIRDRACDLTELEALLLGKAGYLDLDKPSTDNYLWRLRDIYQTQKERYNLSGQVDNWHHSMVRPTSHPQLQLARVAAILSSSQSLFERLIEETDYDKLRKLFRTQVGEYWQNHKALCEPCERGLTVISEDKIDLFIINFVVPFVHAYGQYTRDEVIKDRALDFLISTTAEKNRYTKLWTSPFYFPANAYYSQGLVQLTTEYCNKGGSRCVVCPLGSHIIMEYYKKYKRARENGKC